MYPLLICYWLNPILADLKIIQKDISKQDLLFSFLTGKDHFTSRPKKKRGESLMLLPPLLFLSMSHTLRHRLTPYHNMM